jgi:hypothetical protein
MEYNLNLSSGISAANLSPDILFVQANPGREVIRITHTGELYWNGRLVETDEDFKLAMLDLAEHFKKRL